jgi:choline dehydrogenase-like flavoprotein
VVATSDWWQEFERFAQQGFELTPGIGVGEAAQRDHSILNLAGFLRPIDCPPGLLPGNACLAFLSVGEQAPNPDSRVTLGNRTDALGLPTVRLEWRLSEIDRHTLATGALLLAREIGRLGLGRTKLEPVTQPSIFPDGLWAANHHMGTTRMGDDGVVDRNCRVHGIENLFMAGSSVFPTSGCMNPTLTIVALALRLADHLARSL